MSKPSHVFVIFIRTTPEKLWQAITDPDFSERYYHGTRVESDWKPGSSYAYMVKDGSTAIEGIVLESDPPRRLVMTFSMRFREDLAADPPSRQTWEIEQQGAVCKLTVIHDDFTEETATFNTVGGGKMAILSSLKTLLETGEPLPF